MEQTQHSSWHLPSFPRTAEVLAVEHFCHLLIILARWQVDGLWSKKYLPLPLIWVLAYRNKTFSVMEERASRLGKIIVSSGSLT